MEKRHGSPGVTLIELCFVLAVVGILVGVAVPGMRTALRNAAVRSATFELLAGLQQARARAIVESKPAIVCLSDTAGRCLGGGLATAWTAFVEGREAAPLAGGPLPRGLELRATRTRLAFSPDAVGASTGTLTICDRAGLARPRSLVLSQTGRIRQAESSAAACAP